jgi:hypothetical protein
MMECAEIIYSNIHKFLDLNQFDNELQYLTTDKNSETKSRKIKLVGAKRKLDQFFSYAGQMGYKGLFNEIKRKDLITIRVIDTDSLTLCGYITAFLVYPSNSRSRILLLTGIHINDRWLVDLDDIIFYRETRKALVNFTKRVDAEMLCVTQSGEVHSSCSSIRFLLMADLEDKPVIKLSSVLRFPEKSFGFSEVSVLWKKISE